MKRTLQFVAVVAVALLVAAKTIASTGLDELEPHLAELGWETGQLTAVAGGYSTGILAQTAHGVYASTDPERPGEVTITLQRSMPLQAWRVASFSFGPSAD
ncbi:MAG: hypothetical protein QF903_01675 [Planctomycetota bacterium]|jgi:hypothetical protein|nr:hypothetical protein [Planctomycetota bacterium]MDP6408984.1 hypothetical protein [Planctomycetota bacterium]MDP6764297.1 hypothetical protein [Planctomycetota bacterium]MDP6988173.1 hypothetical protein [Planctomycetota bacterium]